MLERKRPLREFTMKRLCHLAVPLAALVFVTAPARADSDFYTENEILNAARGFFGETTGRPRVQKVFSDLEQPRRPRKGCATSKDGRFRFSDLGETSLSAIPAYISSA